MKYAERKTIDAKQLITKIFLYCTEMLKSTIFLYDFVPSMRWSSEEFNCTLYCIRCTRKGLSNGGAIGFGRDSTRYNSGDNAPAGATAIEFGQCWLHHGDILVTGARAQASTVASKAINRTASTTLWSSKVAVVASETRREIAGAATIEIVARIRQSDGNSLMN